MRLSVKLKKSQLPVCSILSDRIFMFGEEKNIIEIQNQNKIYVPLFEFGMLSEKDTKPIMDFLQMRRDKESELLTKLNDNYTEDSLKFHVLTFIRTDYTFLPIGPIPKGPKTNFKNMKDLHLSISCHCCNNKKIQSYDDPIHRLIGWICQCGMFWSIGLTDIKREQNNDVFPKQYREYIKTSDGRKKLAEMITDGWTPAEWEDDRSVCNPSIEKGNGVNPERFNMFQVVGMVAWKGSLNDLNQIFPE